MNANEHPATYLETFDRSPGGWCGCDGNSDGLKALEHADGSITSRSPWWVDYNHAPPGAGYLHIVFCLHTKGPFGEHLREVAGENHFASAGCPRDLRDARITVRLKGEMEMRGGELVVLVQSQIGDTVGGWLLTSQPLRITSEGREQTITLVNDESQWTCLGARHDRGDFYAHHSLESVLREVNTNIIFVLFPISVVPMGPIKGDVHFLRAGKDYPLWRSKLPEGYVSMDTIEIEFARN